MDHVIFSIRCDVLIFATTSLRYFTIYLCVDASISWEYRSCQLSLLKFGMVENFEDRVNFVNIFTDECRMGTCKLIFFSYSFHTNVRLAVYESVL